MILLCLPKRHRIKGKTFQVVFNTYDESNDDLFRLKGERKKFKKNYQIISYAIIFGQRTSFSVIKLVFSGKPKFYLFYFERLPII